MHRHAKSHARTGRSWINYVKINDSIARHDPSSAPLDGVPQDFDGTDPIAGSSALGYPDAENTPRDVGMKSRGGAPPSPVSHDTTISFNSLPSESDLMNLSCPPQMTPVPISPQTETRPGQAAFGTWATGQTSVDADTERLLAIEDDWLRILPDWGGQDLDFISRLTPFPLALDPCFPQYPLNQQRDTPLTTEEQTVPFMLSPASSENHQTQRVQDPPARQTLSSSHTTNTDATVKDITSIPFSRTKQHWLLPSVSQPRAGMQLWKSIVESKRINLLCERTADNYTYEGRSKRLKFNETSRQRLQAILRTNKNDFLPMSVSSNQLVGETTYSGNSSSQQPRGDVPATTLLDMSLDLYIGQCNGKLPIAHSPTFITEVASPSFLLAASLFGFLMFRSKGAPEYVGQTFPVSSRPILKYFLRFRTSSVLTALVGSSIYLS